ncbi:MAG: peroxiredoxin family protein [Gemmatimonadetes bacterium]|nr:peroxiredoxin family protein [Gemmatimonadota bacterium]
MPLRLLFALLVAAGAVGGCRRASASEDAPPPDTLAAAPADRSAPAAAYPRAPSLVGTTGDGEAFSLGQLRGHPVILLFYRGAYCEICLERLRSLAAHAAAYGDAGARIVAVTLDPPATAEHTARALELGFPVVSVPPTTFRRWGLLRAGEARPRPGEFVLDAAGRVRFAHVGATAADSPGDVVLLGELQDLESAPGVAAR